MGEWPCCAKPANSEPALRYEIWHLQAGPLAARRFCQPAITALLFCALCQPKCVGRIQRIQHINRLVDNQIILIKHEKNNNYNIGYILSDNDKH